MIRNKVRLISMVSVILWQLLPIAVSAQEQNVVISSAKAFLRDRPSFLGKSVAAAPYGAQAHVLKVNGDWRQVTIGNKLGWVHKSAIQDSYYILKEIGKGNKTKDRYKDDVVAAGKGFSPEYEAMMKAEKPSLNYSDVDKMESWKISIEGLAGFGANGGLNSETLK